VNCIRTIYTLHTAQSASTVLIDEPELSLHPELQKNLYQLLLDFAATKQIIVVTHSPHFMDWAILSNTGTLHRVGLNRDGFAEAKRCSREALRNVSGSTQGITSGKYYDAVSRELFFSDVALPVEGPDDVNYISNFLEKIYETNTNATAPAEKPIKLSN